MAAGVLCYVGRSIRREGERSSEAVVNQRQGFLVSAMVHLVMLMILVSRPPAPTEAGRARPRPAGADGAGLPAAARGLRQLLPRRAPRRRRRHPAPAPTTPPPARREGPDQRRAALATCSAKGPMILRREEDLTAVPKGVPDVRRLRGRPPRRPAGAAGGRRRRAEPAPGRQGLRLPPGWAAICRAARKGRRDARARSARRSRARCGTWSGGWPRTRQLGIPSGHRRRRSAASSSIPQGADFTLWVNHFKNEVYRNWIVPQPALMGFRGHVDFEFTVERDGTMSALRMLKSSGTPALDRAAQNALAGSRFLPLPCRLRPAPHHHAGDVLLQRGTAGS